MRLVYSWMESLHGFWLASLIGLWPLPLTRCHRPEVAHPASVDRLDDASTGPNGSGSERRKALESSLMRLARVKDPFLMAHAYCACTLLATEKLKPPESILTTRLNPSPI